MEAIEAYDISDVNDLWNLFSVYEQIPESILGFRFAIARRLITVALDTGVDCALEMALRLRQSGRLKKTFIRMLENWVDTAGKSAESSFRDLFMAESRFATLLSREATRMHLAREDPCIIRNTVSFCACLISMSVV